MTSSPSTLASSPHLEGEARRQQRRSAREHHLQPRQPPCPSRRPGVQERGHLNRARRCSASRTLDVVGRQHLRGGGGRLAATTQTRGVGGHEGAHDPPPPLPGLPLGELQRGRARRSPSAFRTRAPSPLPRPSSAAPSVALPSRTPPLAPRRRSLRGLSGEPDVPECSFVASNATDLPFFATKVRSVPGGAEDGRRGGRHHRLRDGPWLP